jgi:hypothetical protein
MIGSKNIKQIGRARAQGSQFNLPHWTGALILSLIAVFFVRGQEAPVNAESRPADRVKLILARNAFNLNPPKTNAPVKEEEPPPAEVGDLFLTGFSTMISPVTVYLMSVKDGTNNYYSLSEGQRQKGIEALEIDTELKKVKIKRDGKLMTLNFKDHGRQQSKSSSKGGVAAGKAVSNRGNTAATSGARPGVASTTGGPNMNPGNMARNGAQANVNSGQYNGAGAGVGFSGNRASGGSAQAVSRGRNSNPAPVNLNRAGITSAAEQRILMETYNALRGPGGPPLPGLSQPAPQQNYNDPGGYIDDGY